MIVGSIKENTALEKRVSVTPESAKNIIGLGLKVCIEKDYALHLGIQDIEYKNFPPKLSTCSFDAALTSVAETIAPNLLAVAIACKPATPAPIIKTLAAGTVPAAVIIIGTAF